jgi:hypothetical protein
MTGGRKAPRWVTAFLRALERTGAARAAAEDAGVDHTTAYQRRRAHADFAAAWVAALAAHEAKTNGRAPTLSLPPLRAGFPSPAKGGGAGEELIVSGGQLRRVSAERWGKKRQATFLNELAATGNIRRACDAVEISYEAVRKRRRKDPHLDSACHAAIAVCKARAPEFLASAMVATFDPDALPGPETNPLPKVTIAEAIRIAQLRDTTAQNNSQQSEEMRADELEELRERVVRKFLKLRKRRMQQNIEQGWSYDESHDQTIPPGWVRENPAK